MSLSAAELALNAASAWIGPLRHGRLLERFGDADAALRAGVEGLCAALPSLKPAQARALLNYCSSFDAAAETTALSRPGVSALRVGSTRYPARLAQAPSPPAWLFVEGKLPPTERPTVAVVGTRRPTEYGRRMARTLAAGLARAGVCVVSGLARGIDVEAHQACLEAGGCAVAVLGSGLDRVWPSEHRPLARRIVESDGALVSQFSMAAPPLKLHFPMRNSVISGLCLGVVVVEGARDSGSMITANQALEQGREVFAVPGPADSPQSQGPLDLISQGARLVRSVGDILGELGLLSAPGVALPGGRPALPALSVGAARLLDCIGRREATGMDEAGDQAGLDAGSLAAAATELELLGLARRLPGARLGRV